MSAQQSRQRQGTIITENTLSVATVREVGAQDTWNLVAGESGVAREFLGGPMHAVYLRAPHLYDMISGDPAWMHVNINHKRRCFFVALTERLNLSSIPNKTWEDKAAISEAHARTMFNECMGQEVDIEIISRSSWTAGLTLVAEKMSERRIFIAGDAAHLFTPRVGSATTPPLKMS